MSLFSFRSYPYLEPNRCEHMCAQSCLKGPGRHRDCVTAYGQAPARHSSQLRPLGFGQIYSSLLEKAMAPHSSALAWKIPWTEEPGRLQSMGSLSRTQLSDFTFTFQFHALEKEMATHSSVLAWRIPETGEPGGLLSLGSHRVGHD